MHRMGGDPLYCSKLNLRMTYSFTCLLTYNRLAAFQVTKKFEQSGWGKRIKASTLRANLSDFEKFKVNKLKLQRRRLVGAQVNKAAKK